MKKIFVLISILTVMVFFGTSALAETDINLLSEIEILPKINCDSDEPVSRAEFAYTIAKIMGSGIQPPTVTSFSDVDEDNVYSGYINYLSNAGIISGTSATTFSPDSGITPDDAYTLIVKCMGYNEIAIQKGGYPEGYTTIAMQLGLGKGIIVKDGFLTCKGMVGFMSNAIEVEYEPPRLPGRKYTLLTHKLEINGYQAKITAVNNESRTLTAKIEKNLYETNKIPLASGGSYTYKCDGSIDMNHFENAPVKLYIDKDDNIVAILLQNDVEIVYGNIYSVNGDDNSNNSYAPEYIQSICIDGDTRKYDMESGAVIEFNEKLTNAPVPLIENFAKIIMKEQKVLYISAWDLSEGGIITNVSDDEISYIRGSNSGTRIKDLDKYTKKLVLVNGESVDTNLLKNNTYFDWFSIEEDTIVIVASEMVITDELNSYSDEMITIGGLQYDTNQKHFYMAEEDGVYRKGRNLSTLTSSIVTAYFDYADRCVYIRLYEKSSIKAQKFLAALDKVIYDENDEEIIYATIWTLEPDVERVTYQLSKRIAYNDGLTLAYLEGKCQKVDGSGVFEITVNKKGEISAISNPTDVPGFTSSGAITSIANSDNIYVNIGGKTIFLKQIDNIVAIYVEDDVFKVKKISSDTLKATTIPDGATLKMYGDEEVLGIRMAVLCGSGLNSLKYSEYTYGIVSDKKLLINDDYETMYELKITGKSSTKLVLDEMVGSTVPQRAFIIYNESAPFTENGIIINKIVDMTGDRNEWTNSGILIKDTVKRINDKMVMFGSGEAYFLNPTYSTFIEIDEEDMRICKSIKATDINEGDTVYYHAGSEVRVIIVEK